MKNNLSLNEILLDLALLEILQDLLTFLDIPLRIEDLEENILMGQSELTAFESFPILFQGQVVGYVKGSEGTRVVANLLTYVLNQKSLIIQDELTRIANRRYFNQYFQQEWKRCFREQLPLSLVLGDLDYFKRYNDYYGHQMGDNCLQQIAQTISNYLKRPADLVARYGGEEFVILLPNTSLSGAEKIAIDICQGVRQLGIPHRSSLISSFMTISLGITSVIPNQNLSPETLIVNADYGLYQAKAMGRNRCYVKPVLEEES